MIVLLYLTSGSKVTGYEVLPSAPNTIPTGTEVIAMDNVPEAFFESPSDYVFNGSALSLQGTASKRILTINGLDATTKAKVNATPWARNKLVKTTTFKFL